MYGRIGLAEDLYEVIMTRLILFSLVFIALAGPAVAITCSALYGTATCECKTKCISTVDDCRCEE